MIDIIQWRVSIGAFNNTKSVIACINNEVMCDSPIHCKVTCTCQFFPLVWFVSIYYVLNIFFQICLLRSGDIETNPGPVNKTCPSCDAQIPIRKKACVCGHVFNQKYRSLQHYTNSPPINTVNDTAHIPTCTLPSKHIVDVPSTGTSIELDDTAMNISCITPVEQISRTAGVGDETKGVGDEIKGVSDETKGVSIETKGVSDETKGVSDKTKGMNDETKGVSDEAQGVSDETIGVNDETIEVSDEIKGEYVTNENMNKCQSTIHVDNSSLSQPSEGSVKWSKRSAMVNAKRRLQYKLNPIGKRLLNQRYYNSRCDIRSQKVLDAYHANPSNAKRRMFDAYHANPSPIKEKARERARDAYAANPSPIKEKARERARDAYSANPSRIKEKAKERARDAYTANPSPIKRRARDAYTANPSPIKQRARDAYTANPSPIKEKARERARNAYATNPSPIKRQARRRARDTYSNNPSPKQRRARNAYKINPSPIKRRAMHSYNINPSPVKRRALEAYYKKHELNKIKRRQLYRDNRVLDRRRISKLVACSVLNKYSKICVDVPATAAGYIYRLTKQIKGRSYVDKHTTAQYLVNTCKHYRGSHKAKFIKQFHHLRNAVRTSCVS